MFSCHSPWDYEIAECTNENGNFWIKEASITICMWRTGYDIKTSSEIEILASNLSFTKKRDHKWEDSDISAPKSQLKF